jgi:hypothetical protein
MLEDKANLSENKDMTLLEFLDSIHLEEFKEKYYSEVELNNFDNFVKNPILLNSPEIFFNFSLKALVKEILTFYPEELKNSIFMYLYNPHNFLGIFHFTLNLLTAFKSEFLQNLFLLNFSNIFPDFNSNDEIQQLAKTEIKKFSFPISMKLKKIFINNIKTSPRIFESTFSNIKLPNYSINFTKKILEETNHYKKYFIVFKKVVRKILKIPHLFSIEDLENTIFESLINDNSNYGKYKFLKNFLFFNNYYENGENRNYVLIILKNLRLVLGENYKTTIKMLVEENTFICQLPEYIKLMMKEDKLGKAIIGKESLNHINITIANSMMDEDENEFIMKVKEFEQFNFPKLADLINEMLTNKSPNFIDRFFISLKNITNFNSETISLNSVKFSEYFKNYLCRFKSTNHDPLYEFFFEFFNCLNKFEIPDNYDLFIYIKNDLVKEFSYLNPPSKNFMNKIMTKDKINSLPYVNELRDIYDKLLKLENFFENKIIENNNQLDKINSNLLNSIESNVNSREESICNEKIDMIIDNKDPIEKENETLIPLTSDNHVYQSYFFLTLKDLVNALLSSSDKTYPLKFF